MKIVLVRKSNRHKWLNAGAARDKKNWVRIVYLAQRDYKGYQTAYIEVNDNTNQYDIFRLPQNAEVNPLPDIIGNPSFVKALENFYTTGAMPITPPIIGKMVQLGILQ